MRYTSVDECPHIMIKSIKLSDFRNFKSKRLEFSDKITVISGPNATGKTNILESLFLLSTGRSFKAKLEVEMIKYEQELGRVDGTVNVGPASRQPHVHPQGDPGHGSPRLESPTTKLEAIITKGENGWPKKKLLVNGVPKRLIDFAGNFKTVLFGPWDMDLVTASPSLRRKFLDGVLCQVDREYRRSILSYEKGVRQRNRLLFRIREEGAERSQLLFWNQLLIKNGNYITDKREEFIDFVNNTKGYQLEYDRSVISEGRLEQYKDEEVAAATTLVGPHRDDFIFFKDNGRELSAYGSRGEQRMGVLWLKMAELSYIEEKTGDKPTLLLDDIFSELDSEHRSIVVKLMGSQQTIMTTADNDFVDSLKPGSTIVL
jgi:DNA replication and repair protein RecF